MKKILALILSVAMLAAMALTLTACNNEEEAVDVGIVLPTKEEPRWLRTSRFSLSAHRTLLRQVRLSTRRRRLAWTSFATTV